MNNASQRINEIPEHNAHIRILAEEYVALVDAMRNGDYADDEEWRRLSSDRALVHDELIMLTGLTERHQMYAYCRNLLARS
ncbi:MAG TPA: hypothetical protein VFT66_17245 [Roseiflexaceae bacterium]|jgi:hypothetical protein|nr:hypothetical protein [Roseiflexaceae bacterium]